MGIPKIPTGMKRKLLKLSLITAIAVSVIIPITIKEEIDRELKTMPDQVGSKPLTEMQTWRVHLLEEITARGLKVGDYRTLAEVIQCESSWRQYAKDGSVLRSSGNIGLGQINQLAHEQIYSALGLDPNDPIDNLTFTAYLYDKSGLAPWRKWSGWCWESKIPPLSQRSRN